MSEEFSSYTVHIDHLLFVTHAVPPERVQYYLPEDLVLDTLPGPENDRLALVTVTCCLNREMRWSPGDQVSLGFHQSTYRTYVRRGEETGVYFLGNYVEKGVPYYPDQVGMGNTFATEFDVSITFDEETDGYSRYYLEGLSDGGDTIIQIRSDGAAPEAVLPFRSGEELSRFITGRRVGFYPTPDELLARMRVEHEEMTPVGAELLAGQFDLWEELSIVHPEEFEAPHSVLLQPRLVMTGFPAEIVPPEG